MNNPTTWSTARISWLESLRSPNTRRAYNATLNHFRIDIKKPFWEISGADLIQWQTHLKKKNLSPATINRYLAAISSFYAYCSQHYTIHDPETGRDHPLALSNPADKPVRAQSKPYRRAIALTLDQARALLLAIDRSTIAGLRNYAIIVSYLLTGYRNTELRTLTWSSIRKTGSTLTCSWTGKGNKTQPVPFPWPAYHTITDYLKKAGRIETIKPNDYIFTATTNVATRLPCVTNHNPNRPLSGVMINHIVQAAARRAGLEHLPITTHTLRHTAAMLRKETSNDLQDLQRFLHHSSLNTTQIYIDHLTVKPDLYANQIAQNLGVS